MCPPENIFRLFQIDTLPAFYIEESPTYALSPRNPQLF
jgi:hypothetical protein